MKIVLPNVYKHISGCAQRFLVVLDFEVSTPGAAIKNRPDLRVYFWNNHL